MQTYEVIYRETGDVEGWNGQTVTAASPEQAFRLVCGWRERWSELTASRVTLVSPAADTFQVD